MSKLAVQNIRLGILMVAIVAGIAVQKADHHGQHTDCRWCLEKVKSG